MNAAKSTVAHHQNVVARMGGFNNHIHQRIDIGAPVRRLYASISHFSNLPRDMLRLQQEDLVRATERRRQVVFANAHFHGVRTGFKHGKNTRGTANFAA